MDSFFVSRLGLATVMVVEASNALLQVYFAVFLSFHRRKRRWGQEQMHKRRLDQVGASGTKAPQGGIQ